MIEITMPRLSDTMEEGAIATWHKHPGDRVEVGDVLVEIETDKATMDYEAYEAGTLSQILVDEGATVTIGTPIALLDDGNDAAAPAPATVHEATPPPTPVASAATPPEKAVSRPVPEVVASAPTFTRSTAPLVSEADRRFASPLVRKLAREHALDLSQVHGSGPGGRIIRADLNDLLAPGASAPTPGVAPRPVVYTGDVVDQKRASEPVQLTKARRVIARRLGESAREIPHYYVTAVADAEVLVQMRADLNEQLAAGELKISINDLIIRASALALVEHPAVNASYLGDESPTMLIHHRVNIGIAVASKNGLVVPVIVDADQKSVAQLGAEAKQLALQAGTKGLTIDQMSGGTFTISNLGMYGVEEFTAIINPPEGAILAVGATKREPTVVGEVVVPRYRMRFTLSSDHRIIDGALAAEFLRTLTRLIENPWRIVA
jgi:pyruvate dehydrogenase E2 component (dihydrolipoamide acetyltransferase)